MLLEKERARTAELEQEVARLQAALARQNEVIVRLEQRDAERERELQQLRLPVTGLTEQNALLRQQVALLTQENAQHTTVWTVSTPQVIYVHHGRRTNEEIDGILGADYEGTIVADCYAAYDHFLGLKQRCWVPAPEA
jgi:Fe-S cluster assembly scaffold protein SufB